MDDHQAIGTAAAFMEGIVSVPYSFFQYYRKLELTEVEAMLVLHLIAFRQREHNDFPTIEQLQQRIEASPLLVSQIVGKLVKAGLIEIEARSDPCTGIQFEKYNFNGLFQKLANCQQLALQNEEVNHSHPLPLAKDPSSKGDEAMTPPPSLFSLFEQEFGRLLTPTEYEILNGWLDDDHYSEELIRFALKEAVFSGKLHFRYIDRILLDWQRNRITSLQQAREYTQQFRMR